MSWICDFIQCVYYGSICIHVCGVTPSPRHHRVYAYVVAVCYDVAWHVYYMFDYFHTNPPTSLPLYRRTHPHSIHITSSASTNRDPPHTPICPLPYALAITHTYPYPVTSTPSRALHPSAPHHAEPTHPRSHPLVPCSARDRIVVGVGCCSRYNCTAGN